MSLDQLETVSMDDSISVPEGFCERLAESVMAAQTVDLLLGDEERPQRRRTLRAAGAAAAVTLLVGTGVALTLRSERPKDTFDDPYLAYAQVQKAFDRISDGLQKGMAMADDSQDIIDRTTAVFTK